MFTRILKFVGVSLLFVVPSAAQFGVGGNRKKGASFQELNEQAKQEQEGGLPNADELAKLQQLYGGGDAEMSKQMEEAMQMMMNMSPEELEKQMQDAMKMLTDGDMMKQMMDHKEEILQTLEDTKAVPPEELARFRTDDKYFEEKMAESFDQMKDVFNDPEMLKTMTDTFGGMAELMKNPEMLDDLMKGLAADFSNDEEIEKARLQLLGGTDDFPEEIKSHFETVEMQEILQDPKKWRDSVREGAGMLTGANVGEL